MSNFQLNGIDPQKCFILHKKDIEKRLDPFYYIPSIIELENKVKKLNPKPLRYYVKHISSGATPKTTEAARYYSDAENGVPFLRVQNLSSSGLLELDECKYINWDTHGNYLKRSQVSGGDLLVKITGVGRMAVASVAPEGFIGNTNQHMVVIKTENQEVSEILAAYLNTDIGEALASRRTTGGTRPALDYPALLSIPIVYDKKILEIYKEAIKIKEEKEAEAKELLKSIDDYLLAELGITLPEKDNSLENRIFKVNFSEITEKRFDPFYNNIRYKEIEKQIDNFKPMIEKLENLCYGVSGVVYSGKDERQEGKAILRANNITLETNELNFDDIRYIDNTVDISKTLLLRNNDILMSSASGSKEHVGKVAYINKDLDYYFGGFMMVLRQKLYSYNHKYLFEFLASRIFREYLFKNLGGTNINNLSFNSISKMKIPLPEIEKQNDIVKHIQSIRDKAKQLQNEAKETLENTKNNIEKMILGE